MLINILVIFTGVILKFSYVKKNRVLGYKSTFAQKNELTWETANKVVGNLLILTGVSTLVIMVILRSVIDNLDIDRINLLIVFILIIISMIFTEIYLRVKFKSDGTYRVRK